MSFSSHEARREGGTLKEDWREGTAMVPTLSHFNLTLETSSSQPTVVPKDRRDELMRIMASPRLIFWLNLPAETSEQSMLPMSTTTT